MLKDASEVTNSYNLQFNQTLDPSQTIYHQETGIDSPQKSTNFNTGSSQKSEQKGRTPVVSYYGHEMSSQKK